MKKSRFELTQMKTMSRALKMLGPIAPNWSTALKQQGVQAHMLWQFTNDSIEYCIEDGFGCIVGEGLGLDKRRLKIISYSCKACRKIADEFVAKRPYTNYTMALMIIKFVNHFHKNHGKKK